MKATKWCARHFFLFSPVRRIENYEHTVLKLPPISLPFFVSKNQTCLSAWNTFLCFRHRCYSLALLSFFHWIIGRKQRKPGCNESLSPNHSAAEKKEKMKPVLRCYCAVTNSTAIMLSLVHGTASPQLWLISPIYCWLSRLAQLHVAPSRLPGLSGIENPPIFLILTPCHKVIVVLPPLQPLPHTKQSPLVCFTGNDRLKNEFGPERPVQHQPIV